ncbi:MAG: ATP-binding cassette domain-containing protein [Desulfobacteraceae bacterium]|jgi:ATP-binding cassette subfamily F protein 3
MIAAENLSKSYGGQVLFDGISFKINAKERVGLVGRNGHGKTTLFRIIIGEEDYDSGQLTFPKGYRIGHVRQQLRFTQETVLEEGMRGLPETEKDHHWKVEKVLAGLGFSPADLQRRPDEFSGGFQVRLNLAKVLVSEPDMLLLDEPTNYLDITSIRWIERFLLNWPREVLLITHDRSFMDRIVTHTLGIHRKKIRKITGDTEKYYTQVAQDEEIYEKTRLKDERRAKEVEQFITRFRAKARLAGLVQSRIKTLAKLEKKTKLQSMRDLEFSFRSLAFRGKHVLGARELSFAYPRQSPLFKDLDIAIHTGDRVCVVGPNGRGKTTLLKVLAGQLHADSGELSYHPAVVHGFYEQTNIQTLNDLNTVEEEMLNCHPEVDRQQARNICAAMLFEGDAALKRISVLSGGEKARVMLGKLLATPVNLLLLDEPSNHLDMESCDALVAAIDNFEGAVIMVTHNEMFLHALAQRLIVFDQGLVYTFEGTYQAFLDKGGWGDEATATPTKSSDAFKSAPSQISKKELRQQRSIIISERSRKLKPIDQAIEKTETAIEAEEQRLTEFNEEMVQASRNQDGARIAKLSPAIRACQNLIDRNFEALENLYEKKEALQKAYDRKLNEIGETNAGDH